jgi:ectoine hydroxylase-related dioxygenase (phytanoyl-CoA dioxygenase family)
MLLRENIAEFYAENGYVPPSTVYAADDIARYRQFFAELEQREGHEKTTFSLQNLHLTEPIIWEMATHPQVLDQMQQIMGTDILLFRTVFMCKYPALDANGFFAWHQDGAYWGLEPPEAHIAWIALDDSDVENGCLRVIPGSHKGGIVAHGSSGQAGNFLRIDQAIPAQHIDESCAIDLVQEAGTMSAHHAATFHASKPNRSNRRRCGLIVAFVAPHIAQGVEHMHQQVPDDYHWRPFKVVRVRGADSYHHFTYADVPRSVAMAADEQHAASSAQ